MGPISVLWLGACVGPAPAPPNAGTSTGQATTASTGEPPGSSSTSAGSTTPDGSSTTGVDPSTSTSDTTGPPTTCSDPGVCDPNATCDDTSGRVQCTCNPGYEGDGTRCSVDATLALLRVEVPCGSDSCGGQACEAPSRVMSQGMFTGDPAVDYAVTLRIRGVVEENEYANGVADGFWYIGGNPINDVWNTYALEISEPPQTYYLNNGLLGFGHCEALDYERTISIHGQATVTLAKSDSNGCSSINLDEQDQPIVIPDIPPAPAPFDGQFVQVDAVSITPEPLGPKSGDAAP